jgi:cysteine-S-conjugate beta-lyase
MHLRTQLTQVGRHPPSHEGAVNPPVQRGSTVLIEAADELYADDRKTYGLEGFSTQDRLADALTSICGGAGAVLAPSGLQALTLAIMAACPRIGDHLLVTDSAYGPTRRFCSEVMAHYGVETTYFDPLIGSGIAELCRPDTRLIVLESPGSLTFEMQDVPAIVAVARDRGIATLVDDTWSAGVFWKPLSAGVDISMQALTKYQGGHADLLAGALVCREAKWTARLKRLHRVLGIGLSAEDAWLCLRGLRTMALRLEHQDASARQLARWLETRPEVARVIHPALPSHPQHGIWTRDFSGAGGLFSIVLRPVSKAKLHAMLEACRVFSMGFSWGGYESLIVPCDPQVRRTARPWTAEGPLVRLSVGLEAVEDLVGDLEQAFRALS